LPNNIYRVPEGSPKKEESMRSWKTWLVAAVVVTFVVPAGVASAQQSDWVKIDCGKVMKVLGNTVVVRRDSTNKTQVFKNISPDVHFIVNGKSMTVYDLREGMQICAYREMAAPEPVMISISENEIPTVVDEPDEYDAPPPAPMPEPKPEPAPAALPHTASALPMAGLFGVLLLGLSFGIGLIRRF
jgi:hypothetical protein